MDERHYTIAEANAMLPSLTRLLEDMREFGRQLAQMQARRAETREKVKGNGHHNPIEDPVLTGVTEQLERALRDGIAKLAEWNIQLKDLSTGLIDFPARREGRTVFLCWQLGEPQVGFWHEIESGFAGRQPLDDLLS
jgi:hypothetical protein